jgi:hypothetical protein
MKRMFTASLCLFALLGAVSVSTAQTMVWPHKVTVPIYFRTTGLYVTLQARDPKAQRDRGFSAPGVVGTGTGGFIDSLAFERQGAAITAASQDTTAPISTIGWAWNPGIGGAPTDSATYFRITLVNAGDSPAIATLDSVYFAFQVSADRYNWSSVSKVAGGVEATGNSSTDLTTSASMVIATSGILLTVGPQANYVFHQRISGMTASDLPGLWTWPMFRIIIFHDQSAAATTIHHFKGFLTYWSATDNPNN